MEDKGSLSIYLNELLYRCNTINKGFIYLLKDKEFVFDNYKNIDYEISKINELIDNYGYKDLEENQQKYFFKHSYIFFKNNSFNSNEERVSIISSIAAYVDSPLDYIITILNRNITNPSKITIPLKTDHFKKLLSYQLNANERNINLEKLSYSVFQASFPSDKQYLYIKINNVIKENSNTNFFYIIKLICNIYEKDAESKTELADLKITVSNNIISTGNLSDKKKEEIDKLNKPTKDINIGGKFNGVLNEFFNPAESYIDKVYDKYKLLSEKMYYDSKDCRTIKSILYLATYILKNKDNKDFKAAEYMNNIINADVGWAIGDENNKKSSFYGNSDIAKFIYAYYPYMTGKENPYTNLIDNKIVKEMDYNAIMINKWFKDNGFANIGLNNDKLKDVYNLLVNFKEIVKVIDAPISLTGTYENFISGIISSMLNSAATTLDFSLSSVVKSLFYVEIIPLNNKRYSLANIYNYINFIKLILRNAGEYDSIDYIDREEFINQAYDVLGINRDSLKRIGYLAYDSELNDILTLSYNEKLFKNEDNQIFTIRRDLKLLYSLIQFGIQKKSVLTGDIHFEDKFLYGDEYAVNDILNYLTDTEIYYIFKIYNINMWALDDNLGSLNYEDIFNFNKDLLYIDGVYDHHNTNFYNVYLSKSPNKLYEEMEDYDFKNTKYEILISNMLNYYRKILKYNKEQLDIIVFESNDISDIDDFFVRFIPSITELLKLFGQNASSIQKIADFLDDILLFISERLFKNLFLNIKIDIKKMIKKFTDDMFKELSISEDKTNITIDFNFGESKFMQGVDLMINLIEKGNFNFFSIQSCFDEVSEVEGIYDPMEYDDLIFNHGHNSISRNEFFDDTNNSLDKSYIGSIEKEPIKEDKNNSSQVNKNTIYDTIIEPSYSENKKIYYENGNILIEKNDGTITTVVSKNDRTNLDYSYIEFPDIVEKLLSQNEYQQLIEIRDYIDNITNKEIQSLNKQLTETNDKLKLEMNKNNPNYNVIKNLNKNIQELTSAIDNAKKENRILSTEQNAVVIQDFKNTPSNHSEILSSSLDDFFKKKKEILKEVNDVVIDNDVVLTNYQITELLK